MLFGICRGLGGFMAPEVVVMALLVQQWFLAVLATIVQDSHWSGWLSRTWPQFRAGSLCELCVRAWQWCLLPCVTGPCCSWFGPYHVQEFSEAHMVQLPQG